MQISISNIVKGTVIGSAFTAISRYFTRVTQAGAIYEKPLCVESGINSSPLLQQASMLMIPSGYKGGTAYAELPSNGNGDLTWTRGSDAFRTNASGVIQRVPWNLLPASEDFLSAVWNKQNATISTNTTTAPNGTVTADKLIPDTTSAQHRIFIIGPSIATADYTFSCYAKADGYNFLSLGNAGGQAGGAIIFNLTNGAISGTAAGITPTITNVGNGWYRCSISLNTTPSFSWWIIARSSNSTADYTGNGTDGISIWGAQLVEGTTAQTYLPTTDRLNFPRLSYMYGSCPSALLEPQRTNVVLWNSDLSQSVWSKTNYTLSSATAIQGLTATRITKNATSNGTWNGSGARNVINSVGTFASGTKAFSVLLRKGNTAKVGLLINGILVGALTNVSCEFDFSTETFTNVASGLTATFEKPTTDVYRLILVCNDTGTGTSKQLWIAPIDSSNNTVTDGYVDVAYFQWELGAYATTIIPTTSATATRVADSFSRSNIYTNGLISASGGTWFVELRGNVAYTRDSASGLEIANSGFTQRIILFNAGGNSRLIVFLTTAGTVYTTTTDTVKLAIKWNGSTASVFANGTKVANNVTFTGLNMENLIGGQGVPFFIQQMALFPEPLTDTKLIELTTL